MDDDDASARIAVANAGITRHSPTPPDLGGDHQALIEQAERYLRTIGVQPDDDAWQRRRALILQELARHS